MQCIDYEGGEGRAPPQGLYTAALSSLGAVGRNGVHFITNIIFIRSVRGLTEKTHVPDNPFKAVLI